MKSQAKSANIEWQGLSMEGIPFIPIISALYFVSIFVLGR
jgi:hypothetical protein